jgi:hypothetical protein
VLISCFLLIAIIDSYWRRLISTASRGVQQRFIETFDFYFQSVTQEAQDRARGAIPDLESYIALRRDTSGCRPSAVLIEYANNLDIPDEVMEHPIIRNLSDASNDLVSWSNVSVSSIIPRDILIRFRPGYVFIQSRTCQRPHV